MSYVKVLVKSIDHYIDPACSLKNTHDVKLRVPLTLQINPLTANFVVPRFEAIRKV